MKASAILLLLLCLNSQAAELAFPGAQGFGAHAQGGRAGRVLFVTTLDDTNREGSLRWAVSQIEPRIIRFKVQGVIQLKEALEISSPFITIDGRDALAGSGEGITIRDYPITIQTHDVIVRYLRVRLGDYAVLKRVDEKGWDRHQSSADLDCITIDESRDVIIDHVSASWSTDEIISITNSRNITIQWTILSEPIANPRAHPYGDAHAYAANNSASTLTYHHCLFAHYVMRGPQFEANDMEKEHPFDARFEAVNNVMYAYTKSGSRYRTGFEKPQRDKREDVSFFYHFVGNKYVNQNAAAPEIEADDGFSAEPNIAVYLKDNIGPHNPDLSGDPRSLVFTDGRGKESLADAGNGRVLKQVSSQPLFDSNVVVQDPDTAFQEVVREAGCSINRDIHDIRVIDDLKDIAPSRILRSQEEVGGWPTWRRP